MEKISLRTINEFRKGKKEAFEEIFNKYKDSVYYIAYLYVKNYDEANDCVQEVFIRLIEKIHLYDETKAPFDAWFYAMARSCILNHIRKTETYFKRIQVSDEEVLNYADKDLTELNHILCDLEKIMGEEMYLIYVFRIAYDLSFEHIAQIMKKSRETVRRSYIESVKIVDDYMRGEKDEIKQKAQAVNL